MMAMKKYATVSTIRLEAQPAAINYERDDYSVHQFDVSITEDQLLQVAITDLADNALLVCYPNGDWQVLGENSLTIKTKLGSVQGLYAVNDHKVIVNLPTGNCYELDLTNKNFSELPNRGCVTSAFTLGRDGLALTTKDGTLSFFEEGARNNLKQFRFVVDSKKQKTIKCEIEQETNPNCIALKLYAGSLNHDGRFFLSARIGHDMVTFLFDASTRAISNTTFFTDVCNNRATDKLEQVIHSRSGYPQLFFRARISKDLSVYDTETQNLQMPETEFGLDSHAHGTSSGKVLFIEQNADKVDQARVAVQSYF